MHIQVGLPPQPTVLSALMKYNSGMEVTHTATLTPEQMAAINAGDGFARFEDPQRHIVYTITCEPAEREYDDDYIREKIAEADADIKAGRCAEWNVEEIKAKLAGRIAKRL